MDTIAGSLGEVRGSTSKGISLSTTVAYTQIPKGTKHITMTPRNLSTAVVARVLVNPYLVVLKTADALATAPTDYSEAAQDDAVGTDVVLSALSTAANLDFLYVGSHVPFLGVNCDIDSVNGDASVLTVKYRKSDDTWADITATDGTASGGATFAVDGSVTWAVPSDWIATSLLAAGDTTLSFPFAGNKLFWTRWQVSAALDAATTLNHMLAINRSTNYFELVTNQTIEMRAEKGPEGVGCVQALTDAGTANLVLGFSSLNNAGGFAS